MINIFNDYLCMFLILYITYIVNDNLNIDKMLFGKINVNVMRSIICGTIAHNSYKNFKLIWDDKCLENNEILENFKSFHYSFINYFIFDLIIMLYQIYKKIMPNLRMDLLIHHIIAINSLLFIENEGLFSLSILIGLSEGMSIVSGFKLISNYYGNKYITNLFIYYRIIYLIFVRMIFLWPSLIYLYNDITINCDNFKKNRNFNLLFMFLSIIIYSEIKWIFSGKKELMKILY